MNRNKILIASDGASTILVVNGNVCDAESIAFKASPTESTLDIVGMDIAHLNGGLTLFSDYVQSVLGYKVFLSKDHIKKGFTTSLIK